MGLFDIFTEARRTFNWLFDNYFDATEMAYQAKLGQIEGRLSSKRLTRNIPTEDKAWLAEQENSILEIDRCIKDDRKKQEIIDVAKKFKRAFLYFCKKEGISPSFFFSMDGRPSMPGETEFKSFRPLSSFSAKSYERPLSPLKALSFWDKHFQGLVEEALDEYGYKPKFAYENNTISIKKRVIEAHCFCNSEGHVGELISLLERTTPQFPYGIRFLYYNKLSVDRTVGHELISAMYQHISEFEKKDKEISALVERERLWKHFEDCILAHELRQRYYRGFFHEKYGTEEVSLEIYESLAKDLLPLETYIADKEADYNELREEMPSGLIEFESKHPNIPHFDYGRYRKEIQQIEEKSPIVLFPERQTEFSNHLVSAISSSDPWNIKTKEISISYHDFDGKHSESQTSCVFIYNKNVFRGDVNESSFKYCSDIFDNSQTLLRLYNSKKESTIDLRVIKSVFSEFNNLLIYLIPACLDIYQKVRISLGIDLCELITKVGYCLPLLHYLLPVLREHENNVFITDYYSFDSVSLSNSFYSAPEAFRIPTICLQLNTSANLDQDLFYLKSIQQHLPAAVVTYTLDVDPTELAIINEQREKKHREKQKNRVRQLKRQYPYGFRTFCVNQFGTDDESHLNYEMVIAGENDIRSIQRKEDERVRDTKRREEESLTISRAVGIATRYSTAFREMCPNIGEVDTLTAAKAVIAAESRIIEFDSISCKKNELYEHQRLVCGLPHKYFYEYYSKKKYGDDITPEAASNRRFIWAFKDGSLQQRAISLVVDFLKSSKIASYGDRITFVCIPASDPYTNRNRYELFSTEVCNNLGFRNAFEHIRVCSSATPRRMGGTRMPELEIDREFFKDSFVLLFDDVVTSGNTASNRKSLIEAAGAYCIGIISLGKTV